MNQLILKPVVFITLYTITSIGQPGCALYSLYATTKLIAYITSGITYILFKTHYDTAKFLLSTTSFGRKYCNT